ncbi:uncharacterized protein LOC144100731 [Amblyomma americanum]
MAPEHTVSASDSGQAAAVQHATRDVHQLVSALPVLVRIIEEQAAAQRHMGTQREWGYICALFSLMAVACIVTFFVATFVGSSSSSGSDMATLYAPSTLTETTMASPASRTP